MSKDKKAKKAEKKAAKPAKTVKSAAPAVKTDATAKTAKAANTTKTAKAAPAAKTAKAAPAAPAAKTEPFKAANLNPNLKGKTALVTGSTSGIGLAIAKTYAAAGAHVIINGFGDQAAIDKELAEISKLSGAKALYSGADLTDVAAIEEMMAMATKETGGVDILVNNAGMQFVSPIEDFPVEKWNLIIALNLSAAFHITRLALPYMKKKKWGRIINTASAHSLVASPFKSAYVSAKHGIAGLTKTAALEAATFGVTVNCISPGYVWTPLVENQIPDTMKARKMTRDQVINDVLLAGQPTKEFVTVDQVAGLALYLTGDLAASITGANLSMDGGWTAG